MVKVSGKTAIWTIFSFLVSPPYYTNWEFMFVMQESHVQWHTQILVLSGKNLKNKDFASLTQGFKPPFWVPKMIKTYIIVR